MLDELLHKQDSMENQIHFQLKRDIPSLRRNAREMVSREDFSSYICEKPDVAEGIEYKTLINEWLLPGNQKAQKRLAIVGETQVGKTLLLKNVLRDVRDEYDYIFYVPLDYVSLEDEMNILEFLTNQSTLEFIKWRSLGDFQLFKQVVARLNGPETKVCIVFDDLEKTTFNFGDYRYSKNLFETAKAGFMLSNTLKTWFSNSHKILLSNPFNFFRLIGISGLDSFEMVYVQGCNRDGLKHFAAEKQIMLGCNQDPKCSLQDECLGFVFKNCKDKSCTVCINCLHHNCHQEIQTLFCNHSNYKKLMELARNPKTFQSSSSIAIACTLLIEKVGRIFKYFDTKTGNRCSFERIGRFAWTHYEKKYFFSAGYLERFGLSNTEIGIFFSCRQNKSPHYLNDNDLLYCFCHIMLQEFLAAAFLLSQPFENLKLSPNPSENFPQTFAVLGEFMLELSRPIFIEKFQEYQFCNLSHENSAKVYKYFGKLT